MKTLPLAFVVLDRPVALVGGDSQALSKAELLLQAGARLTIYSDRPDPQLRALCQEHSQCSLQPLAAPDKTPSPVPSPAPSPVLAVVGWESGSEREALIAMARQWQVPVNVIDDRAHCDFLFPALVRRGEVQIAISTGGRAPVLARLLRQRLEAILPAGLEQLALLLDKAAQRLRRAGMDVRQRRALLERIASGPAAQAAEAGKAAQAEQLAEQEMQQAEEGGQSGCIYMVGAGPGNPDLLTLRGLQLLQQADVILYDRLVPEAVLNLARRESERQLVGKSPGAHSTPQEEINRLMVQHARAGKRVCRLKSGDPFVFGRGGEELEGIAQAGISVEVVPGITAASGCAAWEGIPLTHRDFAHSCLFVTAHGSKGAPDPDWKRILAPGWTVVVFMPLGRLDEIVKECLQSGVSADWPVALIEKGTQPEHKAVYCKLGELPQRAKGFQSPSLLICGEVTALMHGDSQGLRRREKPSDAD